MIQRFYWVSLALVTAAIVVGCGRSSNNRSLTVFAAASLTNAFDELAANFEQEYPDIDITLSFAGSQVLATQLGQGARADVYASANDLQMDVAKEDGVIDGDPVVFAQNQMIIIVPSDNPAEVRTPADLAKNGVKLVLGDDAVPVGRYSRTVLENMDRSGNYGIDFQQNVEANIVTLESNVRQIVAKIQLGEADAAIVYRTDVTVDLINDISFIEIPAAFNIHAIYPVAAVKGGNVDLAQLFIDFLLSSDGREVLEDHGFVMERQ